MGAAPSPTSVPSRRLLWAVLATIGGLLVVALIVVLVVWRGGAATPTAGGDPTSTRPVPSVSAEPVPVASAAPAVPTGPHPTTCESIYSPTMLATLTDTGALNPDWTETDDSGVRIGTDDADLSALIESADHLTCVWGSPEGGSGSGLTTNVVFVSAEQSEQAHQRLLALGENCYEELGGIRCVAEAADTANGVAGESHFLRGDIWLATHYVNAGPDGYTHDMVTTIWAGA